MEVAFGTVGVASIIIQLANSIQQLCDFISSVNSAPASVQQLQDELRTLRAVLLPIEQYRLERLDICPLGESLKLCQNSFDRLNETVQGWQQNLVLGGSRRTWGRLCTVMGKKKVEEFKYELDSAKLLVLLALQPIYQYNMK
ncbi:hypothetical protein B0O99DRAFT_590254 [Bisporella sp. PMI_857]|nr:hypothetical protein B0O99DRAFT_668804 [Bisporella sp. PMI_857]KAH8600606.1 hypothetical protein B0O99DRAFT_590254 [Bisporella sp. PMI_857]